MISAETKIVGLFGYPVVHSASPEMHNAAFKALGLNFVYLAFEVKPSSLKNAIRALPCLGIKGVNLTIPHKINVLPELDWMSGEVKLAGSSNTIVVRGNKLYGYNTDIQGFMEDFKAKVKLSLRGEEVLLIGAGGAGRACAIALAKENVAKINIANRSQVKAHALLKIIRHNFPRVKVECAPFYDLSKAVFKSNVLINATSLGMKREDTLPIACEWLNKEKIIYDLIYSTPTRLLKMGRRKGALAFNGMGMLARQAAISFYLWTGRRPPIDIMLKALKKKLSQSHV